jgi:hypothetical protein
MTYLVVQVTEVEADSPKQAAERVQEFQNQTYFVHRASKLTTAQCETALNGAEEIAL